MKLAPDVLTGAPPFGPGTLVIPTGLVRDPDYPAPQFGDETVRRWDLNGLGRPANADAQWGRINFEPLTDSWLAYAKELAMILLNPDHPELHLRKVALESKPLSPRTVKHYVTCIKTLYSFALANGYPANLTWWSSENFATATKQLLAEGGSGAANARYIPKIASLLYSCRGALSEGGLSYHPWGPDGPRGSSSKYVRQPLQTLPVPPEIYFPLVQAAWAYVSVFSSDIVTAMEMPKTEPKERAVGTRRRFELKRVFEEYINNPDSVVPLRVQPAEGVDIEDAINWSALGTQLGAGSQFFLKRADGASRKTAAGRRDLVLSLVRSGVLRVGGLYAPQQKLPGRDRPWRPDFTQTSIGNEARMLRAACYILISALTMMRDSEVQEIRRGSLSTFHGVPAIKSNLVKSHANRPLMYWWVSDPVKKAIEVLEKISRHPTHLFATSRASKSARNSGANEPPGFYAPGAIGLFRQRINATMEHTGLDAIPDGPVTPHMLRRTLALITEYEHGGQIAAGFQLKHSQRTAMSNALTGMYTAGSEVWAAEFGVRRGHLAARRAIDELATAPADALAPRGPGATRFLQSVRPSVAGAQAVEDQTKARILSAEFPDMKFGTVNLCLGDRSLASCLSAAEKEAGVPVRPSLCEPSDCPNSVLLPVHVRLWELEEETIVGLRGTRGLSPLNQARLDDQLGKVRRALGSPDKETYG